MTPVSKHLPLHNEDASGLKELDAWFERHTRRECPRWLDTLATLAIGAVAGALLTIGIINAHGGERLDCLSQIETGNNDYVVGRNGELSRWQISLPVIARYGFEKAQLTNAAYARLCVGVVMSDRVTAFYRRHGRLVSDQEFDLLWHRPAHVLHPDGSDRARAKRFANLVAEH